MTCCCTKRETIRTDDAPKPIGPYNAGIRAGHLIFVSGQAGIDPATGKLVEGGVEAQTRRTMTNIQNILKAAGIPMERVVKTSVFLTDMNEFAKMNAIYAEFFPNNPPARTTVQVSALPKNAVVEIDAIALADEDCTCH